MRPTRAGERTYEKRTTGRVHQGVVGGDGDGGGQGGRGQATMGSWVARDPVHCVRKSCGAANITAGLRGRRRASV